MASTPNPIEAAPPAVDVLDTREAGGRVIRGGVLRLASYVLVVALSVLSAALLTRHLRPARFGEYTTVLSLVALFAAITDAGMSTVGTREFSVRKGEDRDELMRDLLGLRMALTLVGVLLVIVFALAAGYDPALLGGAVLASLGTVALVVQHTYTIPLSAQLRIGMLSALELARQAMSVAAIVALVLAASGVLPLLAVPLAVNLALIPPTAALVRRQISLRMSFRRDRWRALVRVTLAYSLANAVGTLYVYTAQILTSLTATAHQSGQFAAAFRIFIVAGSVPGLLVGGALPVLARAAVDDHERLAYALQRIFEVSLILGVACAVILLSGARFVIHVVAGPRYAGSVIPLELLGFAMIASFLLAGPGFALLSLERYAGVLRINLLAFALSAALTLVLARSHGAIGAAVASICGESALALGLLVVLVRGDHRLRPQLAVVPKVLVAAAAGSAPYFLPGATSLERAFLAAALYAAVIVLLRAIPAEVLELIPRRRSVGA